MMRSPGTSTATLVAMVWLVVGLLVGVLLSAPIFPLLRVTDRDFGRAAAGLTAVAVLMLAVRMHLELVDHDNVPAKNVLASAFNSLLVVKGVFGFAVAVAVLGVFVRRRACDLARGSSRRSVASSPWYPPARGHRGRSEVLLLDELETFVEAGGVSSACGPLARVSLLYPPPLVARSGSG
jgi:hypothetical protein